MENTKSGLNVARSAISPIFPTIEVVLAIIEETIKICEAAQHNAKICGAIMDRVQRSESAVKILSRRLNDKKYISNSYYHSFLHFKNIMEKIKQFVKDVSDLQGIKRYASALKVQSKFMDLTGELDRSMQDLSFNLLVSNEDQRRYDEISLREDINDLAQVINYEIITFFFFI